MALPDEKARPRGEAGRAKNCSLRTSRSDPNDSQKAPAVQASIADLRREFIAECLRVTAIKAAHGADNVMLADDVNAERDIRIAIEHLREAASSFGALEKSMAGGAP